MKRMFLKKRLCLMMVMILAIVTVFVGNPMTAKATEGNITITVTGDWNRVEEISIGSNRKQNSSGIESCSLLGEIDSNENNTISLLPSFGCIFTSIKIGGTDYSSSINTMGDGKTNITVAGASSYSIEVHTGSSSQKTIVWAYDEQAFGPDAFVENGTVKIISVAGRTLPEEEANSGHVPAMQGDQIVVELKPKYGYQVGGVQLNGGATLQPETNVSTFQFTMPGTNVHFKGLFVPASDKVTNRADSVVKDISIGNGKAIAGDSGNAEVILSNPNPSVTSLPTGASLGSKTEDTTRSKKSVNIATQQIVSKGDGNYWETSRTDLGSNNDVELALTVDAGATGYAVIREHSGENPSEIPSYYDPTTGSLIFASNKFSTYTFVPLTTVNNNYTPQYDHNGGGTSVSSGSHKSSSGASAHAHNYEWQTITEPTAEQDGLEAYVCTICGSYKESVPVSAYSYVCTDAAKKVLTAKQNDTLVLKMGRWNSYPKWFMEKLASRSDLTIKLQFEYQHKQYELTIPAGAKIDTECDWYGPLKLCSLYEYTVK